MRPQNEYQQYASILTALAVTFASFVLAILSYLCEWEGTPLNIAVTIMTIGWITALIVALKGPRK